MAQHALVLKYIIMIFNFQTLSDKCETHRTIIVLLPCLSLSHYCSLDPLSIPLKLLGCHFLSHPVSLSLHPCIINCVLFCLLAGLLFMQDVFLYVN